LQTQEILFSLLIFLLMKKIKGGDKMKKIKETEKTIRKYWWNRENFKNAFLDAMILQEWLQKMQTPKPFLIVGWFR